LRNSLWICLAVFTASIFFGHVSTAAGASLDWSTGAEMNLEARPLDVAASSDGEWLFVLVPERVLVYSVPGNQLLKEIRVDGEFDRIAHSPRENALVLSSSSAKRLKFITLQPVHEFDVTGLPHKGPEDAAVTVVVFGDYQ